jgi:hypothetical protein
MVLVCAGKADTANSSDPVAFGPELILVDGAAKVQIDFSHHS